MLLIITSYSLLRCVSIPLIHFLSYEYVDRLAFTIRDTTRCVLGYQGYYSISNPHFESQHRMIHIYMVIFEIKEKFSQYMIYYIFIMLKFLQSFEYLFSTKK